MSLRIRRGTDAQRQGITFDLGEPVFTTDTQKLYVGDGITAGGYNILATSAGVGMMWNATTQKLDCTVTGGGGGGGGGITAIIQDTAPTLGGNLSLGGHNISGSGNIGITGALSTTGTANIAGGLGGNLNLNNYSINGTGNIGITGTIGNGAMTLTNATITTNTGAPTTLGFNSNSPVYIGTNANPQTLFVKSARTFAAFTGITDGTNTSGLVTQISRGTLAVPTAVQPGDFIFYNQAMGYDGTNFQIAGAFGVAVDPGAVVTSGHVPGAFGVITIDATGTKQPLIFDSNGKLTTPNLSIGGLTYYSPNYIVVDTTNTYNLSTTLTYNMLLVTSASLTATINMPTSPTDGQLTSFTVLTNTVTLAVGTGTVSPTFAGSATAGTVFRYVYRATGTTWYRI